MTTYDLLRDAILNKQQVVCEYNGHVREICPHVIGTKNEKEHVLSYQFGGSSSSGLPQDGEWRCMDVSNIKNAATRSGPWRTADNHSRPQNCVDEIDVEVPYDGDADDIAAE